MICWRDGGRERRWIEEGRWVMCRFTLLVFVENVIGVETPYDG